MLLLEYKMHESQISFSCAFYGANKNWLTESKKENFRASEPFVRDIAAKRFGILGVRCLANKALQRSRGCSQAIRAGSEL